MASSSGRPNPWLTLFKLVGVLVITGVLAAGVALPYVGGLGLAAGHEANKFLDTACNLKETAPPEPSTIYASDGKTVLARIFTQDRTDVALSQVPVSLQKALLATEDRRFYQHHGVDMRGLLRSALSTSNGDTQGGSTLTMQYVKQVRYYNDIGNLAAQADDISQTLQRKMEDAQCAIQVEKQKSKDTILDDYLNIAFFGENAYSIQSAARTYFDVDVQNLTLPESAMLVGLLQAPTEYDPFQHPEAAKIRRNQVLQNLVDVHYLTQAQANAYSAQPISLATTKPPVLREGCADATTQIKNAGFFCEYAENWLTTVDGITNTQLQTGGLKIITTLNAGLQDSTQTNLLKKIKANAAMTAVLPVIDPKTGNILAMASNKIFGNQTSTKDNTHTETSIFTDTSASGASTWKLFSLLTALKIGVSPTWKIDTYSSVPGATPSYLPNNCYGADAKHDTVYNGDANENYSQNETLTSGTAKSSNTFYVAMDDQLFDCTLQPIVDMARSLGMTNLDQIDPNGDGKSTYAQDIVRNSSVLQLALGSGLGTSPLAITGAYAAVANGGVYNTPIPIKSVTASNGSVLPVKRSPAVRVVSQQAAATAVQILQNDTDSSDGTSFQQFQSWYSGGGSPIAGKTGTAVTSGTSVKNSRNSAVWFVGMTPNYVATAAVINPANPYNPIPSLPGIKNPASNAYGDYASGLWARAMEPTLKRANAWIWPDPQSLDLDQVPDISNLSYDDAKAKLASKGFKIAQLDATDQLQCASTVDTGNIAYYGPTLANKGDTITVCPSSGLPVPVYHKPPPPSPTSKSKSPGSGSGSGSGSASGSGSPPGGGGGHTRNPHPPH